MTRHRVVVPTSAGAVPPAYKPETIKAVRDWAEKFSLTAQGALRQPLIVHADK